MKKYLSLLSLAILLFFFLIIANNQCSTGDDSDDVSPNTQPKSTNIGSNSSTSGGYSGQSSSSSSSSGSTSTSNGYAAGSSSSGYSESSDDRDQKPPPPTENEDKYIYLSYDDSASTAAVEIVKNYLNKNQKPNSSLGRPWEFLNYENFTKENSTSTGLFDVSMGVWKNESQLFDNKEVYELGVQVSSPTIDIASRKNVVLTLIVDVSGSMNGQIGVETSELGESSTLLEVAKYGMKQMCDHLKAGDIVNIVDFATNASIIKENLNFPNNTQLFKDTVDSLYTKGSTNLNEGIDLGYQIATKYYDSSKTNRVIILTDAYANTGTVDSTKISEKTKINNMEGIYFSGLGFGLYFNEAFLNELTEKGKGAYFSIVTPTDARKAFSEKFISLINVAARDVQFRLDYPESMNHKSSAAEQVSTDPNEVIPTNFSYNTSQFFHEVFDAIENGSVDESQKFKLTINYKDPLDYSQKTESYEIDVASILNVHRENIKLAHLIVSLTKLISGDLECNKVNADISDYFQSVFGLQQQYVDYINKFCNL